MVLSAPEPCKYSASRAVGKGMKATHIKNRMLRKSKRWSERAM
jgi:hypothetical protein